MRNLEPSGASYLRDGLDRKSFLTRPADWRAKIQLRSTIHVRDY
jgi:hypothetical protein